MPNNFLDTFSKRSKQAAKSTFENLPPVKVGREIVGALSQFKVPKDLHQLVKGFETAIVPDPEFKVAFRKNVKGEKLTPAENKALAQGYQKMTMTVGLTSPTGVRGIMPLMDIPPWRQPGTESVGKIGLFGTASSPNTQSALLSNPEVKNYALNQQISNQSLKEGQKIAGQAQKYFKNSTQFQDALSKVATGKYSPDDLYTLGYDVDTIHAVSNYTQGLEMITHLENAIKNNDKQLAIEIARYINSVGSLNPALAAYGSSANSLVETLLAGAKASGIGGAIKNFFGGK